MNWRDAFSTAGAVAGGMRSGGIMGGAGAAMGQIAQRRKPQPFNPAPRPFDPTQHVEDDDGSPAPDQQPTFYDRLKGQY